MSAHPPGAPPMAGTGRTEANPRRMRNRRLHDALRDFALEAAALLTNDLRQGAEIPFDVVEEPGSGSILYRYQPLTSEFITDRWARLLELPAYGTAAAALGSGAEA